MNSISPSLHVRGLIVTSLACAAVSLSSCFRTVVVERPGPRRVIVEDERPIEVLPHGARIVVVRGERCWLHNGIYYRRHPHGRGYVVFRP